MPKTITTRDLELIVGQRSAVVVEVLPPSYYDRGHIPGAVNLPLQGFEAVAQRLLPRRDQSVVVYCQSSTCNNSHLAAKKLEALGYEKVSVFAGGKAEWANSGHSLEVA
jgi:rhodanese-related sulfurtransferase